MYVGFGRFLVGLAVVGVALGVVFGLGVATGRAQRTPALAAGGASSAGASGAAIPSSPGVGSGSAFGAGFGGAGGVPVTGSVEAVTPTSLTVKTLGGEAVTLQLNAQTSVRRVENGALQDIHAGDQVLVTRDASSVATGVQIVPPGTALGGRGGASGGSAPAATPAGGATSTGTPGRRGGSGGTAP